MVDPKKLNWFQRLLKKLTGGAYTGGHDWRWFALEVRKERQSIKIEKHAKDKADNDERKAAWTVKHEAREAVKNEAAAHARSLRAELVKRGKDPKLAPTPTQAMNAAAKAHDKANK